MRCLLPGAATVLTLLLSKVELLLALMNQKLGEKRPSPVHCLNNTCGKTQTTFFGVALKQSLSDWWPGREKHQCFWGASQQKSTQTPLDSLLKSFDLAECHVSLREELNSAKCYFLTIQAFSGIQKNPKKIRLCGTASAFCILCKSGKTCNGVAPAWTPNEKSCSQTWQSRWGQP